MDTQIIISGGGPIGLALSVALARYKVKSIIVEKRLEATSISESRAIVWMPKGIEFLEWIGLLRVFQDNATRRTFHQFRNNGKPTLTLDFRLAKSKFKYSLNLPQHFSETLFEEEARKHSDYVDIRRGHELISLSQNPNSATATILDITNNKTYQLQANFLIGCDGAKSKVRELLDINLEWSDYGTYSAVADIQAHLPTESTDISWIELDAKRPYGLFNFHPDKWRIIYRVNQNEEREEAASQEFVNGIIKQFLPQIKNYTFLWVSVFRLGQGQSGQYSKGRVVLAGDAAHPMGPSAGAGMMVGMLGVWRLAWRLQEATQANDYSLNQKLFID